MSEQTDQHKEIVKIMVEMFKALEGELLAHRITLHALKQQVDGVEEGLMAARNSPVVKQTLDEKYDPILKILLLQVDEYELNQKIAQWFAEWKPQGPIQ